MDLKEINLGWEARIYCFRIVQGVNTKDLVIRVFTGAHSKMKTDFEFQLINRLNQTRYPVPEVYICETESDLIGSPFIIMEKLNGGSLMDHFNNAQGMLGSDLDLFSRLWVSLHKLAARKILPFSRKYRSTHSRLDYRINNLYEQLEKAEITELNLVVAWLERNRNTVENKELVLIHQDFHPGNILFRSDGSPAVIDWSSADLGDSREDLGWTSLLASTLFSPALANTLVDSYESISGQKIEGLDYFEALAALRRLTDTLYAIKRGMAAAGMQKETEGWFRRNHTHYLKISKRLEDITGQKIPNVLEYIK